MRKIFALPFLFLCLTAGSQQLSQETLKKLFDKVDSVVLGYLNDATFLRPGQTKVAAADVERYKRNFQAQATVPDEMFPGFYQGEAYNLQKIGSVSASAYADKMAQTFPGGLTVKLLHSDISLSELNNRIIKVLLVKQTRGFRASGAEMLSTDTVVMNLGVTSDYSNVAISSIDMKGHNLIATVDKDGYQKTIAAREQFIKDSIATIAKCESDKVSRQEALDKLIAAPPHWWISIGAGGGTVTSTLSEGALGYQNLITQNLKNSATKITGLNSFGGDVQVSYFFGQKASFGLGFGLAFNSMKGTIGKSEFAVQYEANDKGGQQRQASTYRQHITMNSALEEEFTVSNLRIPISLIYKSAGNKKLGFMLEAGIAYNLNYGASSSAPSGNFDYEAIYRYQGTGTTLGANLAAVYDNGATPANDSWLLTKAHVSRTNPTANLNDYLSRQKGNGYNVGLGENQFTSNLDGNFKNGAIGFFVRPAIMYNLSKVSSLSLGIMYEKTSFSNETTGYKLVDEGTGPGLANKAYNTLLNSLNKMDNSFIGLRLSFTHALFYKEASWRAEKESLSKKVCDYTNSWSIK